MAHNSIIRKFFGSAKPPPDKSGLATPGRGKNSPASRSNGLVPSGSWRLPLLAVAYVLIYVLMDTMVESILRNYIFCIFLVVSSLYFSWSLGGKQTMLYVAFFNIFFAFIFSRLIFQSGGMQYARYIYLSRSFFVLYIISIIFMILMIKQKSPADEEREEQSQYIEEQRIQQRKLELMVATQKLTQDLVTQANQVKDELLLLQGAWKSQIHSIVNDLPPVKEKELYRQIVEPFQENIISHLRNLETRLSFNPRQETLRDLIAFFQERLSTDKVGSNRRIQLDVRETGWANSPEVVVLDSFKTWEILLNLIRNSQSALELKQIDLLKSDRARYDAFVPRLNVRFFQDERTAVITVTDNGGGVSEENLARIFNKPLPSRKRGGKQFGQGTIFVKFFGESMGMDIAAQNTQTLGERGLEVTVRIPLFTGSEPFEPNGDSYARNER